MFYMMEIVNHDQLKIRSKSKKDRVRNYGVKVYLLSMLSSKTQAKHYSTGPNKPYL